MRIRLALTLTIERRPPEPPQAPENFESQGSLVETRPQPRYVGFTAEE